MLISAYRTRRDDAFHLVEERAHLTIFSVGYEARCLRATSHFTQFRPPALPLAPSPALS
jgi:hypothetical protein